MNKKAHFFIDDIKSYKWQKLIVKYFFVILLTFPFITFAQKSSKNKFSQKAIELQKKAVMYQFSTEENQDKKFKNMLKFLDSATTIEPTYALAYRTKVFPLVRLKRYKEALLVLSKVRIIEPLNFKNIIKQGVIYEFYLKEPKNAKLYYKEAYDSVIKNKDIKKAKNPNYDESVTFCLLFHKGKEQALLYLSECIKNYTDHKSIIELKKFDNLVRSTSDADKIGMLDGNN